MSWTTLQASQLIAAITFACTPAVRGHGFMTSPASRNIDHSCAHCLNSGGPAAVHAYGGYIHGMCGNGPTDADQNWNAAGTPVAIGTSGDSILVEVVITAHHHGFFEFELCDSPNITEECFRSTRLMRSGCDPAVDGEMVCRRWWKPLNSNELGHYSMEPQGYPDGAPYTNADTCNRVEYKTYYDLPEDVSCTHCVLRWHWHTSNSCTSPTSSSEEFWNCADVSIAAPDGATVTTTPVDLDALNAELTSRLPQDLSSIKTDDDYWDCPNPAYGGPGEYYCTLDGSDGDDTSGCVAHTAGETCTVEFYENDDMESLGTPLWSYCTWSFCIANDNPKSDGWCDASEEHCSGCGGTWCQGYDGEIPTSETTTYAVTTTFVQNPGSTATTTTQRPPTAVTTTQLYSTTQVDSTTAQATTTEGLATTTAPSTGSGFCTWSDCNAGSSNSVWCDEQQSNCEGHCEGVWCPATTTTTPGATTTQQPTTSQPAVTTTEPPTTTHPPTTATDSGCGEGQAAAIASLAAKVDTLTALVENLVTQFASSSCAASVLT